MQDELDTNYPALDIEILGINQVGFSADNSVITALGDIPWLQDTSSEDVWGTWGVTYRDVVVLNTDNTVYAVYNVTANNLGTASNYTALLNLFLAAAGN